MKHTFAVVANLIVFDTTDYNYLQNWKSIPIFAEIINL